MSRRLALRHLVCPLDFSGHFRSSLAYASAIGRAHRAELRALHVVPSEGAAMPTKGIDAFFRENLMQRLRQSLAEADPDYGFVGAAVRLGDPALQILRFAKTRRADLIVMGAAGSDRQTRPLGPVASVVVARSECSVLAVPRHTRSERSDGTFSRIVCAVDLAPSSTTVLRQALSLAWETGGRLTCVCVLSEDDADARKQARADILAAIPSEAGHWCELDIVVTHGAPGDAIVALARDASADLLVIGAPRQSISTTERVIAESLCPVLVAHDARPLPWPPRARAVSGAL